MMSGDSNPPPILLRSWTLFIAAVIVLCLMWPPVMHYYGKWTCYWSDQSSMACWPKPKY